MDFNRRDFLKHAIALSGALAAPPTVADKVLGKERAIARAVNMSGYAAPKMDSVKIGVIGLGKRGPRAVKRLSYVEGVEIKALCDKFPDRVNRSQHVLDEAGLPKAASYVGEDGWKDLVANEELDLIYICTPWNLHAEMSVLAMKEGKHVACEVPIAITIDECWELVHTSEETRKHCMMLENCCYDFFEMLTLNMAQQGVLGEIVHAEGAYIHDLLEINFEKNGYADMWRLRMNSMYSGNLYPTHGLGPIAQCLNINRGDRMEYMVSLSSDDFLMSEKARELASQDMFYSEFANKTYRGNMNTTLIRTSKGKTIMLQHDVTSPRPYSRLHTLSGTRGFVQKYPQEQVAFGHKFLERDEMEKLYGKFMPALTKAIGEQAKKIGGHGGMDFIMDWRLIDCLRNGMPLDQDVYDAVSWSVIFPLSERSVKGRAKPVEIPDFTRGAWKTNAPVDLSMGDGRKTAIRSINE